MYKESYELIREILEDEQLNKYVFETTGKALAVIDSGPQVTMPAAAIVFNGGEVSCAENSMQTVEYDIPFALPYWGADGMKKCHDFLDVAIDAFFSHEQRDSTGRRNFIVKANPFMMEEEPEEKWWAVTIRVTVSVFI